MQASIADVLSHKGRQIHAIDPEATVREAVGAMARHNVGALVVIESHRVVGIFSERDVLWRVVHEDRSHDARVREVMSSDVVFVRSTMRVGDAMRLITDRRVRHLPVVENDRLVGLVSSGDLTKWMTHDLELQLGELESYIHGPYAHAQPS